MHTWIQGLKRNINRRRQMIEKEKNTTDVLKQYKKRSKLAEVWRRLKKNKMAMVGLVIVILLIGMAVFAPLIAGPIELANKQNTAIRLQPPGNGHLLGTDEFGRDIFARIVHGSRISLSVGLISVSIALCIGGTLGAIAGFYGGKTDNLIMRLMDVLLAIPSILLAITIVAALGPSMINLMVAVGVSNIPTYARIVRASVLTIKDNEFVEAAKAIGLTNREIIISHIIPNCLSPLIVRITINIASAVLATASLSFIGLGVKPPTPEWGAMLAGGRAFLRDNWYITLFPGMAIMFTILSLNMLGDGIRDALDPRLKQ